MESTKDVDVLLNVGTPYPLAQYFDIHVLEVRPVHDFANIERPRRELNASSIPTTLVSIHDLRRIVGRCASVQRRDDTCCSSLGDSSKNTLTKPEQNRNNESHYHFVITH